MLSEVHNSDTVESPSYTRERLSLFSLLILAGICVVLVCLIAAPFLPGLTWALAFAVVAYPVHHWISHRIRQRELAAVISVFIVAVVLIMPAVLVGWQIGSQVSRAAETIQGQVQSGEWRQQLEQSPRVARAWSWLEKNVDVKREAKEIAGSIQSHATMWMRSAASAVIQIAIALFALFFFFRDRTAVLWAVRSFLPLSRTEADYLFEGIHSTVRATVYGTVLVSIVQGALGGLIFWILDLPAPLLWAVAMALLSLIPMLGSPLVWVPAALFLAAQGNWGKGVGSGRMGSFGHRHG